MSWHQRLRNLVRRQEVTSEIDAELEFHLQERIDDLVASGMSMEEARCQARAQFGNPTVLREETREMSLMTWLESIGKDIRYGWRSLMGNPGFTATALISLALGIGANSAIFSIVNAVLLRSLPVEEPGRLVQVQLGSGGADDELTNPIWEQFRDTKGPFAGALAYGRTRFTLGSAKEDQLIQGLWVSGDYFRTLGVPAWQGRVLTVDDDRRGGGTQGPVAVVSHRFWTTHYPGETSLNGKSVRLNGQQFQVVGITPPWFHGLDTDEGFDVALPLGCEPLLSAHSILDSRLTWWLRIIGRLRPDVTLGSAQEQLHAMTNGVLRATLPEELNRERENDYLHNRFTLAPVRTGFSALATKYKTALYTLLAISGLVLLVACANIANLLLARSAARQREFSVRLSIGASRGRVIRQLMTESLLLSLMGAAGGMVLALWGSRTLVRLLSTVGRPIDLDLPLDPSLLLFSIGVAVVCALLFGQAPAIRGTRVDINQSLKASNRSLTGADSRFDLRKILLTVQVALSMVLVAGATLFIGTFRSLLTTDAGFDPRDVLSVTVRLPQEAAEGTQRIRMHDAVLESVSGGPAGAGAASVEITPMSGAGWAQAVDPEGFVPASRRDSVSFINRVSPGYFRLMRTAVMAGREFQEKDSESAPKVIILNETAARTYFSGRSPMGRTVGLDRMMRNGGKDVYTVVGVVKDSKYGSLSEKPRPVCYLTAAQDPDGRPLNFLIRPPEGSRDAVLAAVRRTVRSVSAGASVETVDFEQLVDQSLVQPRVVALLSGCFGGLALLLAAIGLYGMTRYSAVQRQSEIGVRLALGASRSQVLWMMMQRVLVVLAVGVGIGLVVSLAAGKFIKALLFGVQPADAVLLTCAVSALLLTALAATYIPARSASRMDPLSALREE